MALLNTTSNKIFALFLLFVLRSLPVAAQVDSTQSIKSSIQSIIDSTRDDDAFWSVCIRDTSDNVLAEIHSHKPMTPA